MLTALLLTVALGGKPADSLAAGFISPPPSARPHTWWHWMNGNVTKEGITADLEAMKQAGIGGAQMFTVDQGIPAGKAPYGGTNWRAMTAFAVKEAKRLGLELCIHNCAGWSSSGGPWVTPEDGMQVVAWSSVKVQGPTTFSETLPAIKAPRVESQVPLAREIAIYAYRTPAAGDTYTPPNFLQKTGVEHGDCIPIDLSPLPNDVAAIPAKDIVTLTGKMDASGHLTWDVPAGDWTILRMGYVPVGVHNHPAPPEGDGLEVDKLSRDAFDRHWNSLVGKVLSDIGPSGTKTLNNVLIDSYEVGDQNWTPKFREDFRRLRGYDPLPYLPIIAGRIIDNKEHSERFLWDLRRTIADLFAENYFGRAAELAHKNGMLFSTEPYGNGGFDTITSGGRADIPMGEFWLGGGLAMETTKLASSVAHTYGRTIVGAESFTSDVAPGRWLEEPASMKALGDLAFCNGINRYIFHRYAMQPWLNLKPGMTMGPWGTHLERTQTWWTEAAAWLKYVARCQYLLQAGRFQADVCYFYGEDSPNDMPNPTAIRADLPSGYDYDGCDAKTLLSMQVKNGRIVLPSGMTYRLLMLPHTPFMTPQIAVKVKELVAAGATVYGPKPTQSPSLTNYPACDDEVRRIGDELWGSGKTVNRTYGKGRVVAGVELAQLLSTTLNLSRDFDFQPRAAGNKLIDIHRRIGDADVYFVSSQRNRNTRVTCSFRVAGKVPELWHPESGKIEEAVAYETKGGATQVPVSFGPSESVFVVFRKPMPKAHLNALSDLSPRRVNENASIAIDRAKYGTEDGRGADVTAMVRSMVRDGETEIPANNSVYGDPVPNVVKHLTIDYHVGGRAMTKTVGENEDLELLPVLSRSQGPEPFTANKVSDREVQIISWEDGVYGATDSLGGRHQVKIVNRLSPISLSGPWEVMFAPNLGAPASATFRKLTSWTESPVNGIKYFSGSATYRKDFNVPASYVASGTAIRLNLGLVKNFATVTLNGRPVAVLWKPPFALDVTGLVHAGANRLEVKVTNLWPNRLIGDEQLPPDAEWDGDHLKRWPDWLLQGKPRPKTGRVTFTTWRYYDKNAPLLESGLLGPVTLQAAKPVGIKF